MIKPLLAAFMAQGELQFLERLHTAAVADKWGWTCHAIGPYTLRTNGLAWLARTTATRRMVTLKAVMQEAGKP